MRQATITIGSQQYIVKQSHRALIAFERLTGRNAYETQPSVTDSMSMMWSMLTTCNRETFLFSFDEFLDLIDENPTALEDFNEYLIALARDMGLDLAPETAVVDKKKAETR